MANGIFLLSCMIFKQLREEKVLYSSKGFFSASVNSAVADENLPRDYIALLIISHRFSRHVFEETLTLFQHYT